MTSNAGRGKGPNKSRGGGRSKGNGDKASFITRNVTEGTNNDGNMVSVTEPQGNDRRQGNDENHEVIPENNVGTQENDVATQENDGEGSSSGKSLLEPMKLW